MHVVSGVVHTPQCSEGKGKVCTALPTLCVHLMCSAEDTLVWAVRTSVQVTPAALAAGRAGSRPSREPPFRRLPSNTGVPGPTWRWLLNSAVIGYSRWAGGRAVAKLPRVA